MLVGEGPRAKRVGSHGRMFFDVVLRSRMGTGWEDDGISSLIMIWSK